MLGANAMEAAIKQKRVTIWKVFMVTKGLIRREEVVMAFKVSAVQTLIIQQDIRHVALCRKG